MRKQIRPVEKKLSTLAKKAGIADTIPFAEQPPVESSPKHDKKKKNELAASDLFSLFTADIIKEDVVFTR